MIKPFSEFAQPDSSEAPAVEQDQIPAIFATIHHRSDSRPDGYDPADISWLNVVANQHIPELYNELKADHEAAFPNHKPDAE